MALFNDIRSKINNVVLTQQTIYNPQNPHKDIASIKQEYLHFTMMMISYLNGLREIVVGLLITLNPDDREGNEAFRADRFGRTPEEKQLTELQMKKAVEQMSAGLKQP